MKAAGLDMFEKGHPDRINPELPVDEQAELLPYDDKYKFPRDKLRMGKQLGSGAFGVVVRAIAQDIVPYERETTVAVKMVKQTADNEVKSRIHFAFIQQKKRLPSHSLFYFRSTGTASAGMRTKNHGAPGTALECCQFAWGRNEKYRQT